MFGLAAKHWQKRYFKLCRGRLSWFETKFSVRSRNSLLLDGYTLRKVGQVSNGQIQFELIHADASRRVLKLRAVSKLNFENWTNALESHIEFFDRSPLNFRYEFAGLKFLGTHREQSVSTRIRLPTKSDLSLEPLSQIIVDVAVPLDMYNKLTPSLRSGALVRLRPLLFAQGINAGERVLDAFVDVTRARATANLTGNDLLWTFFNEYKALSPKLYASKRTVETVEAILGELDQKLNEMVEDRERKYEVLLLASDCVRRLGGVRLTNCMSGKDRTGMSVTLEQARLLAQYHMLCKHPARPSGVRRTAAQLVTMKAKPGVLKQSRVMHIADMMRVYGVRLQNCRKNSGKAAYACTMVNFMPECYRPPATLSNSNVET